MKKEINLRDKKFKQSRPRKPVFSILSVSIVLGMFLFFFLFNMFLDKKRTAIENDIREIEKSLENENSKEAYAFGSNLIELKKIINEDEFLLNTSEILKVSEKTIPSVAFSKLNIQRDRYGSGFQVELNFSDYASIINQIKLYKEMQGIKDFNVKDIVKREVDVGFYSSINFSFSNSSEDSKLKGEDF